MPDTRGLGAAAAALSGDGVLALWSDHPPDEPLLDRLREVFDHARAEVVGFDNPITSTTSACTVYVARAPRRG